LLQSNIKLVCNYSYNSALLTSGLEAGVTNSVNYLLNMIFMLQNGKVVMGNLTIAS